ncbi:MAG TPA: phospholipase C, phosphocholine-specific [Terriglobales bacterium]|nr:phospholipase C, phosphocholine-specific [Terriglobales bacterium]
MANDRRRFLQQLGAGAAAAAFPRSILKALEIPARHRTGTIQDVEHVVILMQENRSFDHYFGALRGVRGFGDPQAVRLANGDSVWRQPRPEGGYVLPFHPGAPNLGLRFLEDLKHDWSSTQQAWNAGRHDGWVREKSPTTMAHLVRADIPFHYALADAFTICDAYHCSLLGPTDPNRYHMWTGWVGNDGRGGGPVVDNAEAGYDWTTYPERLQRAGISWRVYQDVGTGLSHANHWGDGDDPYIGNYGDNSLLYFQRFQQAQPGHPLYQRARTGTAVHAGGSLFKNFQRDVRRGVLPQVSWVVAPEAYCEHPNWPANYGAWYIAQVLDALTANPDVWASTALFLTYDENDGFFDHVPPPTPPLSPQQGLSSVACGNEIFSGSDRYPRGPYGLGLRVPMLVISPWSKGGWVNSEVFDHTSLLRFLERRFGDGHPELIESNITAWRRTVCGDLTSAFDFSQSAAPEMSLPPTAAYAPTDRQRHPDYKPTPPAEQAMPVQEPGTRPARALAYQLHVAVHADASARTITLRLTNRGRAGAVLQVRSAHHPPRSYTLAPSSSLEDAWQLAEDNYYALRLYGPNGFARDLAGTLEAAAEPVLTYLPERHAVQLTTAPEIEILDAYSGRSGPAGVWDLAPTHGWYDLRLTSHAHPTWRRRFAGHWETGRASQSPPALIVLP